MSHCFDNLENLSFAIINNNNKNKVIFHKHILFIITMNIWIVVIHRKFFHKNLLNLDVRSYYNNISFLKNNKSVFNFTS